MKDVRNYSFEELKGIIAELRSEHGCPWDKIQTHESLKSCMIEECYEALDAIENKDTENLCEELGDVLLQVLLHSQIAEEEGCFTVEDVIDGLAKKMIRRHPHVFADAEAGDAGESKQRWEEIKKQEKAGKKEKLSELQAVPHVFPAAVRAQKVQKRAEICYGYQCSENDIINTIKKTLENIEKSMQQTNNAALETELQKLLFESVNLTRKFKGNAENSLTNATETFINRFEGNDQYENT